MVIDMVGVMMKILELAKLLIEENVINEEYELLALGTGKKIGGSPYTCHGAVEVIGGQEAYLGDDKKEYHGTARKQGIQWCKIFCKE